MKKEFITFLVGLMIAPGSMLFAQNKSAKISGILNTEDKIMELSYDGAESLLGGSRNLEVKGDSEGRFSLEVNLDKPAFYRIRRNTLYLSPGDNLQIVIEEDPQQSVITGKGYEANNYLKNRTFPKAGSYLEAGRKIKKDPDSLIIFVRAESQRRLNELNKLQNVTAEFKDLEKARIYGDVLNTYFSYPTYRRDLQTIKDRDVYLATVGQIMNKFTSEIKTYVPQVNEERFLNVEVVRYIMPKIKSNPKYHQGIELNSRINELYTTLDKIAELSRKPSLSAINEIKEYLKTMKYDDLRTELSKRLEQVGELVQGAPAIDFEMEDKNGKQLRLSDLKGKYIYIDFWATWCGPCKGEAPYFEKLRTEIPEEDITFIAVSTDNSKKAWLEYLNKEEKKTPQYHSSDSKLRKDWLIAAIPRFILIDKDFKIVDAYAIRPSSEKAKPYFENLLKQ